LCPHIAYGQHMDGTAPLQLRREVLAVMLLDDGVLANLDLDDDGVYAPPGDADVFMDWAELATAADADTAMQSPPAIRRRIARWMRLRIMLAQWAATLGDEYAQHVTSRVRPRALPADHGLHPGTSWVIDRPLGGSTHFGLALRGYTDDGIPDSECAGLLPARLLDYAKVPSQPAISRAKQYVHDMAELAVDRHRHDPSAVMRSLGDADVPTLLTSPLYRHTVLDGQGMRSAAVPIRHRGWLDLGRLDPAFAVSAAELTDPDDRGYTRPILITADEITMVKPGGNIIGQSLDDPVRPDR